LLLWLIGHGPSEDALRAQVRTARLEEHVRFQGLQPNVFPYMKHAQLVCLPSLYEGMPNALAEAMVCGTPVLASDCPSGPREMLADGAYGRLVPPADAQSLAGAIEDAIKDYGPWRDATPAARLQVEHNYSAATGIAKYEALFVDVLAESR
jgi:glycosyltransferase involved in cell wall biosynthesis